VLNGDAVLDECGECGGDGTDESNCFSCVDSGELIPMDWACNCWNDCEDESDEENCPEGSCLPCNDGDGIYNPDWMCNTYSDCADGTDEMECFVCDSYSSLGCDGYENEEDCNYQEGCAWDGRIEQCNPHVYPDDWACNCWNDCADGSDEWNCGDLSCGDDDGDDDGDAGCLDDCAEIEDIDGDDPMEVCPFLNSVWDIDGSCADDCVEDEDYQELEVIAYVCEGCYDQADTTNTTRMPHNIKPIHTGGICCISLIIATFTYICYNFQFLVIFIFYTIISTRSIYIPY
jgi:hypothetical protein